LLILTVITITVLVHYFGWLDSVEVSLRTVLSPASRLIYTESIILKGEDESFATVAELESAYQTLKHEQSALRARALTADLLEEENQELKRQLHFFQAHGFTVMTAEVTGKNVDPFGSSIIVDVGSEQEVSVGDPVIIGEGILVGVISRVAPKTAIVRLLDDHQSKVAATLRNQDRSLGVVEGGYGLSVRMNLIPQHEQVGVGDIIMTSGLETNMPRGLLIGTVEAIEREAYQPFQTAIVRPSEQYTHITIVSVLTNGTTSTPL